MRKSILLALLVTTAGVWAAPLPPRVPIFSPQDSQFIPYLTPLQNHAPEKAWSVGAEYEISSREEVEQWIEQWTSETGRKKLEVTSSRSFPFRSEVDRIMRQSGLPWELASIPVVESNWRISAVSSSGASGPWQFLEASALGRRLIIDAWRDERRDVWRSTEAAMSELAFYDRLFSDWLMALASYNAGPTRMRKLKEAGGFNGFWEMLDAGVIPPETRDYVPQIIAVSYISSHAGRLGLPISWETPREWARVPTDRSVSLSALAAKINLPYGEVRAAHGELNHPVTPPPNLPYSLKVPAESADEVAKWLLELEKSDAPERFWRYTVKSGDNLSAIAQRTGISLAELLSYNGHVHSGVLRIGERLYLPGNADEPPGADNDELPVWGGRYTVRSGDSFWSIARRHRVPPELLAEVNHRPLEGNLMIGSILKVPGKREEL